MSAQSESEADQFQAPETATILEEANGRQAISRCRVCMKNYSTRDVQNDFTFQN